MNHIYKTVWNDALGTWVAVSELSKSHVKRTVSQATAIACLTLGALSIAQAANPTPNMHCTQTLDNTKSTINVNCVAVTASAIPNPLYQYFLDHNNVSGNIFDHQVVTLNDSNIVAYRQNPDGQTYDGQIQTQYFNNPAEESGSVTINAKNFSQIYAEGSSSYIYGIKLQIGDRKSLTKQVDGTVNINGTDDSSIEITNTKDRVSGVFLNNNAEGIATINMSNSNATVTVNAKTHAYGLQAFSNYELNQAPQTDGKSAVKINMSAGKVVASSERGHAIGLDGQNKTSYGSTNIQFTGGRIEASSSQDKAYGIRSLQAENKKYKGSNPNNSLGTASVTQNGDSSITLTSKV